LRQEQFFGAPLVTVLLLIKKYLCLSAQRVNLSLLRRSHLLKFESLRFKDFALLAQLSTLNKHSHDNPYECETCEYTRKSIPHGIRF